VAPSTLSTLQAVIVTPASDVEMAALVYRYAWYRDGLLQASLTADVVLSTFTTRGENWSVEVRASDGEDESPPANAWAVIGNAGPMVKGPLPNPELKEDTVDEQWIDLSDAFEDPDGDPLTWTVSPAPEHITVAIDAATGKVTLAPEANWSGQESVTFVVSDGTAQASQTVLVTVDAVDDPPVFTTVNGQPITSDPTTFTIKQYQNLVIQLGVSNLEEDDLAFSVNTTAVEIDESTGEIQFQPDNDVIGTLRFAVTMTEMNHPSMRARLNITITVENVNDPPGDPRIANPKDGAEYDVDEVFDLTGLCTDPDSVYGQVLTFSWYSNGVLIGYGSSKSVSIHMPGTCDIMLQVSDGEYVKSASVEITIRGTFVQDSDGDGILDAADDFPLDPAASVDSDDDGYPDAWNAGRTGADSTTDLTLDRFPGDPAASLDSDNDGHPDEWNTGKSRADSTTDLELDQYPQDPSKWKKERGWFSPSLGPIGVIGGLILMTLVNIRRRTR